MEPRNEQSEKPPEAPQAGSKPRRFRIVKLEERIAPQAWRTCAIAPTAPQLTP